MSCPVSQGTLPVFTGDTEENQQDPYDKFNVHGSVHRNNVLVYSSN